MSLNRTDLEALLASNIRSGGAGGLTTAADVRAFETEVIDCIFDHQTAEASSLSSGLSSKVSKTGDETVDGVKTFTLVPKTLGTPTAPTDLMTKQATEALVTSVSAGDPPFDSNRAIKRQVIGLQGVNLNKATLITSIEELLYPVVAPALITSGELEHEFGDAGVTAINFTATRTDAAITGITIAGGSVAPTGNTQSGAVGSTPKNPTGNNVWNSSVTDGIRTTNHSFTNFVKHKIKIGVTTKDGIISPITDADVNAIAPGIFATSKLVSNFEVNVPNGNYLMIALPTSFGAPVIFVNGMRVNSFNMVRSNSTLVNINGYSSTFDIYVSNVFMTGQSLITLL